ncbi:MAG: 23S rRNA pseudouridine(2605) synthase RluB [Thiohalomonadales bacterium]
MKPERIQKVMAQAGVGSRRQIETWIKEGRITVDGKAAEIGQLITREQRFTLDGKPLRLRGKAPTRVLILNKPEGTICSRKDPEHSKTVFDLLPRTKHDRWVLLGRLDINTSGLLLVTNNGELANRLMHPSSEIEREYAVRVLGEATDEQVLQLLEGIELEDGLASFLSVSESEGTGSNRWYHVVLKEGRNREVRRLWEAVGLKVSRLIRIRYGMIALPRLLRGQHKELPEKQVTALMQSVGMRNTLEKKTPEKSRQAKKGRKKTGREDAQDSLYGKGRKSKKTDRQPARRRTRR